MHDNTSPFPQSQTLIRDKPSRHKQSSFPPNHLVGVCGWCIIVAQAAAVSSRRNISSEHLGRQSTCGAMATSRMELSSKRAATVQRRSRTVQRSSATRERSMPSTRAAADPKIFIGMLVPPVLHARL